MTEKLLRIAVLLFLLPATLHLAGQWTDPLLYYPFDEGSGTLVSDLSGKGHDGLADCGNCWEAVGKFEGAYHFQGAQKVVLPAAEIGLSNERGTVAFWMLLPETSMNDINCIWWAGEYGGDMFGPQNEMHINSEFVEANIWTGGEMAFVIRDSLAGESYFIYSDPWKGPNPATPPSGNEITLADGQWHHVACTWESGATVALYIDGLAIWDSTSYAPNLWDCRLMTLGVANERANRRFSGYLDEFRLYDQALDAAGIGALYAHEPEAPLEAEAAQPYGRFPGLQCIPNPAASHLRVHPPRGTEQIEICSLDGRMILQVQNMDGSSSMDLEVDALSPGLYLVLAHGQGRLHARGKFIKE